MPHYLLIKYRHKGFRKAENQRYRAVVRKIEAVTFFSDGLNVRKFPARRMGRSRETQTNEFDQAVSDFGSTIFENNRWDSIQTVILPRIKARKGMENFMIKNFNFRDEVVRGWRSRRNMPSITQIRVGSKRLSKFSFRERRHNYEAI